MHPAAELVGGGTSGSDHARQDGGIDFGGGGGVDAPPAVAQSLGAVGVHPVLREDGQGVGRQRSRIDLAGVRGIKRSGVRGIVVAINVQGIRRRHGEPAGGVAAGDADRVSGNGRAILEPDGRKLAVVKGAIVRRIENIGDIAHIVHAANAGELGVDGVIGEQPFVQFAHVNIGYDDLVVFPLIGEGIGEGEEREIGGDLDEVAGIDVDWRVGKVGDDIGGLRISRRILEGERDGRIADQQDQIGLVEIARRRKRGVGVAPGRRHLDDRVDVGGADGQRQRLAVGAVPVGAVKGGDSIVAARVAIPGGIGDYAGRGDQAVKGELAGAAGIDAGIGVRASVDGKGGAPGEFQQVVVEDGELKHRDEIEAHVQLAGAGDVKSRARDLLRIGDDPIVIGPAVEARILGGERTPIGRNLPGAQRAIHGVAVQVAIAVAELELIPIGVLAGHRDGLLVRVSFHLVGDGHQIAGQEVGFHHAEDLLGGGLGGVEANDILVVAGVHGGGAAGPVHRRGQHDHHGDRDAHHHQQRVAVRRTVPGCESGSHAQLGQCEAAFSWMR